MTFLTNDRPYVICHMATTVDGRIHARNWPQYSKLHDLYEKCHCVFEANAWVVGRTTMELFSSGQIKISSVVDRKIRKVDFVGDKRAKSFAIVIDPLGKCRWKIDKVSGDHIIEILTEKVSTAYLSHLQENKISYIFCGKSKVDLRIALKKLKNTFGIKRLLLEGGGLINGSFLEAGLIDELSQLVVPAADGSTGTPALFDLGERALRKSVTTLKLSSIEKMPSDVVWLRYQVLNKINRRKIK